LDNAGDSVTHYELLLAFDTDHPEFCRGFEAGRLWQRIREDHTTWDEVIHVSNAEMLIRMCEAEGRKFRSEDVDDLWVKVEIE